MNDFLKGNRLKKTRVKTAKSRTKSSNEWLNRQLNDPYVQMATAKGYRSRAAFKLIEMDEKLGVLKPGMKVVDLGSAPGGWCQVAAQRNCEVFAVDILEMPAIPGVTFIQGDFGKPEVFDQLLELAGGNVDLVLSDIAPNTTGHKDTDHIRIMALAEDAAEFAISCLKPGGSFIAKVRRGGGDKEFLDRLKSTFTKVAYIKPQSSRSDSAEVYITATGFKGES